VGIPNCDGVPFAVVAFTAWAAALPDSPFLGISADANRIGGFAVVALCLVMHRLAKRWA